MEVVLVMRRQLAKIILILLTVMLVLQLIPLNVLAAKNNEIKPFKDIAGHWAAQTINKWQYYNIISGVGDDKFNPNGTILRRDFAVILDRLFKFTDISINVFNDLPMGQYYTDPILRLTAAGIIDSNIKYVRPNVNITREEATVMICKAFKIEPSNDKVLFTDANEISAEAYPYIAAMQKLNYIKGSGGKFRPKGTLTRAEAITIIDNIIAAMYIKNGTYKNDFTGNGFIATKNVKIANSTINGSLFVVMESSGKFTVENSTISKELVVITKSADIRLLGNTSINELHIRADGVKVNNGNVINKIVVGHESESSVIDGMPKVLVVKPGGKVVIEDALITNTSDRDVTYTTESLSNLIAQQVGSVSGGPTISIKEVVLDADNNVTIEGVSIKSSGDSDVKETGIIYFKRDEAPTIVRYSDKIKYTGSSGNYSSFNIKVGRQNKDEVWTYRAYAINKNGKIGYSKPISVRSYSYEISTYIVDTKYEYNSKNQISAIEKHVQIWVQGDNIPEISSVSVLSGNAVGKNAEYKVTKASLISDDEVLGYTKQCYLAKVKFSAKNGTVTVDNFYGYRIQFKGKVGTKELFPTVSLSSSSGADLKSIKTGDATIESSNKLVIKNNDFEEGIIPIIENGVVILELPENSPAPSVVNMSQGWVEYVNYDGVGQLRRNYTMTIELGDTTGKKYYYAAYVKLPNRTVYGTIKNIKPDSSK